MTGKALQTADGRGLLPRVPDSGTVESGMSELLGADADSLPQLFEEFSRATSGLVSAHDALLQEVEHLKSELAAKNRRLEHKKRLEAIGRVAAGVAHEFRNPLGGIRLCADSLLRQHSEGPSRPRVDQILDAVGHLDHIVEDLLTYTRSPDPQRAPHRMGELVLHALQLAFADLDDVGAELLREGPEELQVWVDRVSFSQALVNLLSNARQAVTGRPDPAIGVWWGQRGDQLWLEVADTGAGVPPAEEERIFHPFHTLRQQGTGLGLAITQSRVEAHDGEIRVVRDSLGGHPEWSGARFRLTLPSATKDPKSNEKEQA